MEAKSSRYASQSGVPILKKTAYAAPAFALALVGIPIYVYIPKFYTDDELISGKRLEGLYIGVWSVAKKLAAALGVGIGLSILGFVGYKPNIAQPESVVLTLRVLYALVPSVCNLMAILIATAYPINRVRHRAIRDAVLKQKRGEPASDPLMAEGTFKVSRKNR